MRLVFQPTAFADGALPADFRALAARRRKALDPELREAFVAAGKGRDNLALLFSSQALCVTTGQQPGLFTGPLYTVYKALTAAALAKVLSDRLGTSVVPVFWVAGDDHDFAEANHIHLLTAENTVERLALRERPPEAPLTPLYQEPVGAEVQELLAAVRQLTRETEFRPWVLSWLEKHYRPETDLASAFSGALAELLGDFGVVVFQPTHPSAKRAMVPWLIRLLERAEDLDRALAGEAERLKREGEAVSVAVGEGATTVMLESSLGRDRLMLEEGRFVSRRGGERWTREELVQLAARQPQRFSPNVLARPVVEAALLPTLAYVAGPGESLYLRQCDPLYRELGVERQAVVPRWSGRVIEQRVAKVLEKYGITPQDLQLPEGQLEARLVQGDMPRAAEEALEALRAAVEREYGRLEAAVAEIDPTLLKPLRTARNEALAASKEIEKRILSQLKRRNATLLDQLAKARHNLFPLGQPQERVLNVVPYLIRYGTEFLKQAFAACEVHALATVGRDP